MKQLLFALAVLAGTGSIQAQKNFEGRVVYRLDAENEDKKPELTALFSAGKIKLTFKENDETDDKVILVMPDSGLVYTISTSGRSYKRKKMLVKEESGNYTPEKKTIAGYSTTSAKMPDPGPGSLLGGFVSMRNMIFDVADSLHFAIPAKYADNAELLMIRNNRIVLAAQMTMGSYLAETMAEDQDGVSIAKKINVNAIEVTPMTVPAAEMNIPEGFTPDMSRVFDRISPDTAAMMLDTPVSVQAKKPVRKPAKKPAPAKKTPTKSAAYRKQ